MWVQFENAPPYVRISKQFFPTAQAEAAVTGILGEFHPQLAELQEQQQSWADEDWRPAESQPEINTAVVTMEAPAGHCWRHGPTWLTAEGSNQLSGRE